MYYIMGRLAPHCCFCMAELSSTRRADCGSRFLQTGQRPNRHHAARHGLVKNIWGQCPPLPPRNASTSHWASEKRCHFLRCLQSPAQRFPHDIISAPFSLLPTQQLYFGGKTILTRTPCPGAVLGWVRGAQALPVFIQPPSFGADESQKEMRWKC